MTAAQRRFLAIARQYGAADTGLNGGAPYWDVVNDWVNDKGSAHALAFRNSVRTVNALIKADAIHVDDDGLIRLGRKP
jgi:hypothetical protein